MLNFRLAKRHCMLPVPVDLHLPDTDAYDVPFTTSLIAFAT
jgi:hypothetical protein